MPPINFGKNYLANGKHAGILIIFSCKYQLKLKHFVNFSFIIFGQMFRPPKLTELLRIGNKITNCEFKFKSNLRCSLNCCFP